MAEEKATERKIVRFAQDAHLFKQYERSKDLYILKSGLVKIYKTEGNFEVELDTVKPGGVVGEVAAIDDGWRSASAVALEDSEAYLVSYQEFQSTMKAIPEWFYKIARILVQRLREVDEKIDTTVGGDKTPHVASVIAMMTYSSRCLKTDAGWEIDNKLLNNELFDIFSLSVSDIGQALARLAEEGYLTIEKSKIVVRQREPLEAFADEELESKEETPAT